MLRTTTMSLPPSCTRKRSIDAVENVEMTDHTTRSTVRRDARDREHNRAMADKELRDIDLPGIEDLQLRYSNISELGDWDEPLGPVFPARERLADILPSEIQECTTLPDCGARTSQTETVTGFSAKNSSSTISHQALSLLSAFRDVEKRTQYFMSREQVATFFRSSIAPRIDSDLHSSGSTFSSEEYKQFMRQVLVISYPGISLDSTRLAESTPSLFKDRVPTECSSASVQLLNDSNERIHSGHIIIPRVACADLPTLAMCSPAHVLPQSSQQNAKTSAIQEPPWTNPSEPTIDSAPGAAVPKLAVPILPTSCVSGLLHPGQGPVSAEPAHLLPLPVVQDHRSDQPSNTLSVAGLSSANRNASIIARKQKGAKLICVTPLSGDTAKHIPRKSLRQDELLTLLMRCVLSEAEAVTQLHDLCKGRRGIDLEEVLVACATRLTNVARAAFDQRMRQEGKQLTEAELFTGWLETLEPIMNVVKVLLDAKAPGTRKQMHGMGRLTYPLACSLIGTYIAAVVGHSSPTELSPGVSPPAEHVSAENGIAHVAKERGMAVLRRFDELLYEAFRRFKKETSRKAAAPKVRERADWLNREVRALAVRSGFGEVGDGLFMHSRTAIWNWGNYDEERSGSLLETFTL
ncbi:hypothetical protein B0H21DRAFT_582176 [Amylocystis lapponica]|nr:hypothetical protein B0H21DRAFT_582176 [Amylocystis lapponica]